MDPISSHLRYPAYSLIVSNSTPEASRIYISADTMEERTTIRPKIAPQFFAAFSVTLMILESGFHGGWSSPAVPKLLEDAITPVTLSQSSWVISLFAFGCAIGPLISIPMVERWGRKTCMLLNTVPFFLSCALIGFAQNYWWYYVGRFLCGFGVGFTYVIAPMYIGEIAEDRVRGALTILIVVMFDLGYTVPYSAGPWVSRQVLVAIGALFPIMHLLTFSWVPETPYYHFMKNRPEEARKSLEWFRGTSQVDKEIEIIRKSVELELKNKGSMKELFTDKGNRKALLINIALFIVQECSGISIILGYSTMIFNEASPEVSSDVAVMLTGIVQLVTSVLVAFLVDRTGRRTLLILSMFLSTIFLIGQGVYFQLKANGTDVSGISWLPVTAIIGYLCSFALGMGSVPMSLLSEMFACNVKTYATAVCVVSASVSGGIIQLLYPLVKTTFGIHVAFYFFAGSCVISMIFTFYLPETMGKSLSEIQDILQGRTQLKLKENKLNEIDVCDVTKQLNSMASHE